ncbi:hypothetical protein PHMEG_0004386 [Phytophthora megakarya]|uniref:Uncharacterized protein n=1 Tax=Phytophthora megakarya TaxID=4795 RepID=A0A225WTY7_9STRA|nr:hypothetical protein PHMEG_0004386 [Phytophthora megakarya]
MDGMSVGSPNTAATCVVPPKNEFRSRAELLDLQGVLKMYMQTTEVVTFMTEMTDGPVKTYVLKLLDLGTLQ